MAKLVGRVHMEWKFIDGSIVKAHQHSTGARKGEETAIGKSVAGNTSKIHIVAESHGNPVDLETTEGQKHDVQMAPALIERTLRSEFTVGDKGYDGVCTLGNRRDWLKTSDPAQE